MAKKQNRTEQHKKAVLEALEKTLGIVTQACKLAGVGRTQFYQWMKEDVDFYNQVQQIDDLVIDFAESKLHQQINDGNTSATIFYLKTKGRKRGYVEGLDITSGDEKIGGTSQIEVIFKDMSKPKEEED